MPEKAAGGEKWSTWMPHDAAVRISEMERDAWAGQVESGDEQFVWSGDTLVVRIGDYIFDCQIRRRKMLVHHEQGEADIE